jgi:DNA polymerase-3 subunit epsilon
MQPTTGFDAAVLEPTGPGDLVEQLNRAARRPLLWPWLATALLVAMSATSRIPALPPTIFVVGALGTVWLALREAAARSVVVFYEVLGSQAHWFEQLVSGFEASPMKVQSVWRVEQSGRVRTTAQYKTNSGASELVQRSQVRASLKPPRLLKTNLAVPTLTVGRQSVLVLPDRLLVRSGRQWSDVDYRQLHSSASRTRFIESGSVPRDAQQLDTTWQFVNVKGGPDRRYKNNRRLPVMQYGEMTLASAQGLHWLTQWSRPDACEWLVTMLQQRPAASD